VAALQNAVRFFDCLSQILSQPAPREYEENTQSLIGKSFKWIANVRTGFMYSNLTGRCYFAYIIQYTLEKYRFYVLNEQIPFYSA
jgi:hypothetical protein